MNETTQQTLDVASQAKRAALPVIVTLASKSGAMTLQDWVYVATLVYIGLQAAWLVWRWYRAAKSKSWKPRD